MTPPEDSTGHQIHFRQMKISQISKLHLKWYKKNTPDFVLQLNYHADTHHPAPFYVCYTRFSTLPCSLGTAVLQIGLGSADAISDEKSNLPGALLGPDGGR